MKYKMGVKASGFLLVSLFIILTSFAPEHSFEDTWATVRNTEAIQVFAKKNSIGFKDIRIEASIQVPLSDFIQFINDVKKYPQWVFKCNDARQLLDRDSVLQYWIVSDFPFPFRDREIKVISNFAVENNTFRSVSRADSSFEGGPGRIVIRDFSSQWLVKELNPGEIKIEYEVSTNPGGSIPAWLANMAVDIGPYKTMVNLKNALEGR
ncbi:MAG: hypothetical protein HKN76_20525 [Saprospiraceae bacterium]|nr:hypothetical protein [Saprospiraceae bacterium]